MAVIKYVGFCPRFKKKTTQEGFFFPFADLLHYALPLGLKFLPETFVALNSKEKVLKGFVTLEKKDDVKKKLKITRFFLEENELSVGEQLINYVVSKYCALGATSFEVTFAQHLENVLELFVNTCKFRVLAHELLYKTDSATFSPNEEYQSFKNFKNSSAKAVCELYNSVLNSHQRHAFKKQERQFRDNIFGPVGKNTVFKYVLENEETGIACVYFTITTSDNKNWVLESVISYAFNEYFTDVLSFCAREISRRSKDWTLYIKLKSSHFNFEYLEKKLQTHGVEFYEKYLVLTRDFLKPEKESALSKSARIMFGTTALEL